MSLRLQRGSNRPDEEFQGTEVKFQAEIDSTARSEDLQLRCEQTTEQLRPVLLSAQITATRLQKVS